MPNARYYRRQAHLLLQWASETQDPDVAAHLKARAAKMMEQARVAAAEGDDPDAADSAQASSP
jgi:hypothetical protein